VRAPGRLEAGLESLTIRGGADVLAGGGGHGDPGLIFDAAAGNSTMAMFNFNLTMLTCLPRCMFALPMARIRSSGHINGSYMYLHALYRIIFTGIPSSLMSSLAVTSAISEARLARHMLLTSSLARLAPEQEQ
jgi:hypothetical protein